MKKCLEQHVPFLKYSPCYGAAFSIIDVSDENLAWLFNNYSYFYIVEDTLPNLNFRISGDLAAYGIRQQGYISYHNYWGIKSHSISKDFFNKYFGDILSFCKNMIIDETYIFMFVNEKYISEYHSTTDCVHPLLISGFDDEQHFFYVSDFFGSIYQQIQITYEELETAFLHAKAEFFSHEDYLRGITLYQKGTYYPECCTPERTEEAIWEGIRWAVDSHNLIGVLAPSNQRLYGGLKAQNILCEYLLTVTKHFPKYSQHKLLELLVEYKKIMELGIIFLEKNGKISALKRNVFQEISNQYNALLMRYLYLHIKHENERIRLIKLCELIDKLNQLTDSERDFYTEILAQ